MKRTNLPPIIVDTREQTPLVFPAVVQMKRGTLKTGDYSIVGYEDQFAVERKSLPDLVHTVIHERERFERELERMRPFRFRRLLVTVPYADVSAGSYPFSRANPRSVIASINAFEMRYGVPAVFAAGTGEAATRVVNWAYYFVRETTKRPINEILVNDQLADESQWARSVARGLNHTNTTRQSAGLPSWTLTSTGESRHYPARQLVADTRRCETNPDCGTPRIISQAKGDGLW